MFCPKCGKVLDPSGNCPSCGFGTSQPNPYSAPNYTNQNVQYTSPTGANGFVTPDEKIVFSLKNGNVLNLISGEGWKSEDAILTNRRLYYNDRYGVINVSKREEIVNIEDITGTKIAEFKPIGLIIIGVLFVIAALALMDLSNGISLAIGMPWALISFLSYFFSKKSFLSIEYAGGSIRFSVRRYGLEAVRAFQRVIFQLKSK